MRWQAEEMVLGYEPIDSEHRAFFEKLSQANAAADAQFAALFLEINDHLIEHFAHEDNLMDEYNFSAKAEHKAEHRRILGEMNQFRRRVEQGRLSMARCYLSDTLPDWFKLHLLTMDGALVAQLTKHN